MDITTQHDEGDTPTGDLLVGGDNVRTFLISLGFENPDPYYLKKRGWPIGKSAGGQSASLIASKRRLIRHAQKITAPTS
jgi:hypothetical protein